MTAEGVLADFNAWSTPDIKESCALTALSASIIVEYNASYCWPLS
jgi:hypothetical protein